MRKVFLLLTLVSSLSLLAGAQNVRWDLGAPGSAGAVTTSGTGLPQILALGSVKLNWCNYPANAVPCTNYANTYPSISSAIPCSTATQVVLQGSNSCVATGDANGNLGVYTAVGTYAYTLTVNGVSSGPYVVSLQGTSVVFNQTVAVGGANQTQRQILNLIAGANMTIGCVDNAGLTRLDCTFASIGGGGGGFTAGTDLSGTSINQTVLGSSNATFYFPGGSASAPGAYPTNTPKLGLYTAIVPNAWTVSATSTLAGTATLTLGNTSGWPFSFRVNDYIVTSAIGGGYDCATPCLLTAVNSGTSQISYVSAGSGNQVSGSVNVYSIGIKAQKLLFDSMRSTSINCANGGSIQLCAPDTITDYDNSNNYQLTLLKKNVDAGTADTRSAQVGDDTYGAMTHAAAPFTVGGTLNVAGPIGMLSVQPVSNLASKLNNSGFSVGTSGRWYASQFKGLGIVDPWGQVVIASQPGAGASVYSDATVDQVAVADATGIFHFRNFPAATCLTGLTYTPVTSGGPSFGCASAAAGAILLAPTVTQSVAQPSAGGSASGTSLNVNVFENARYADQFAFTQSPGSPATIAIGANVVTINAVRGISALSVLSYARHYLWLAGTGTPEAALLTATTCTGSTTGTCTVTFTAANAHSAGYSIATATAGYQEALDDALSNSATNPVSGVTVLGSPVSNPATSQFVTFNAPFTVYVEPGTQSPFLIDGLGTTIACNVPGGDCIKVGTHASQLFPVDTTIQGFAIIPAVGMGRTANGNTVAIHDAATNTKIQRTSFGFINTSDVFDTLVKVDNDQHSVITQIELNSGNGPPMKCDSTWCGAAILGTSLSNGSTGDISHSDLSMSCKGNPIDWQSGNTLHVSDDVIQAYNQFGIRAKGQFAVNPAVDIDNGYWEIGNCTNPLGVGTAGLIVQNGWAKIGASIGPTGKSQLFANSGSSGATQYNYFLVTKSSTGSTVSAPMLAGYTTSDQTAGNVTVKWWKVGSTGTITYDIIRTSGTTATPLTTATCGGGSKTVCGSRATGLTVGGACVGSICSFTDDPSANTVAYAVAIPTFYPLLDFWPDSIVLAGVSDGNGTSNATTPTVHIDRIGTGILQSTPPNGVTNQYGNTAPSVFAMKCDNTGWSPVWFECQTGDPAIAANFGMLLEVGTANSNTPDTGNKGRVVFEQGLNSAINGTHYITLVDSSPAKTLNDSHHRPTFDANDTWIGLDNSVLAALNLSQLAFGSPTCISQYIANTGDNSGYGERLCASLKTFKVPVVANSTLVVGGAFTGADANGLVFVDGTRFANLCGAMAFAAANATRRSKVYDLNPYEAWTKDPFNDATCGNFSATNVSPQVYLGLGNFINGTGGTIHIPTGVELYLGGRASENQLSTTNGCGTATPTSCTGTLIIAYSTAAPFTGGNAMACASCTLFPINTPVIDFGASPSFGTLIQGPGSISCAGVAGSTGIANAQAQEQSFLFHLAIVGCQAFAVDWNGSAAQNSWIDDLEILSGNLTGATIGTPTAFIGVRISINAPNRHYGNFTCNTRGAATVLPVTACVKVINSRGGRVHDVHYENANYGAVVDGSSNVLLQNINTSAASVDASTPVALVKNCASGSSAPCTSGISSTNLVVQGLQRTSPNITTNAIVDDNATGGTITWANWTGEYNQAVPQFGAFSATVTVGSGTSTSNGTAILAGASQAQPAITITGATVTDVATCSLNASPVATWQTGIQLLPAVVTLNTVTPWLSNPTAGSITPAATAIRCTVTR